MSWNQIQTNYGEGKGGRSRHSSESCQVQPPALPDGHSVNSYLKEGLGAWPGWGRQFVKSTAYATWYSEGYVCVALYLSFLRGFLPRGPVTPCRGNSSADQMPWNSHMLPHNYLPMCPFLYPFKETTHQKTQPESLPVASLLRQESCDRDFRPSPAARGSPRCSPLLLSSGCSLPRACQYILPSCNWETLHSLCTQSWWKILLALQLQKTWDRCQLPALQMRSKLPLISAELLIGDQIRGRQKGPLAVNNGATGDHFCSVILVLPCKIWTNLIAFNFTPTSFFPLAFRTKCTYC